MGSRLDIRLRQLDRALASAQGQQKSIMSRLKDLRHNKQRLEAERDDLTETASLIQQVALETQRELEFHISSVTTLALSAVFPDPYELQVHFLPKRGKSEASLVFHRDGVEIDPMSAAGGGTVDLAAFSLRVSMLTLRKGIRRVIVLDEPFRFLSKDLHPRAGKVIADISHRMGIQFLIVTHEAAIAESADRMFSVTMKDGKSCVVAQ